MESFTINTMLKGESIQMLVIPDDCDLHSIFHLIVNGVEISKIKFTDPGTWTIIDGMSFNPEDFQSICFKIDEYFK